MGNRGNGGLTAKCETKQMAPTARRSGTFKNQVRLISCPQSFNSRNTVPIPTCRALFVGVRAFITHGGYGSTTEAVYHGVPLVGLPMFGDQTMNMDASERAGFAVTLDFNTFSEESLLEAINKVLYDARYRIVPRRFLRHTPRLN